MNGGIDPIGPTSNTERRRLIFQVERFHRCLSQSACDANDRGGQSLIDAVRPRPPWGGAESRSVRRLKMTAGPLKSGLARRITGEDVCQHRRINGFGEVRVESRIERALFVV